MKRIPVPDQEEAIYLLYQDELIEDGYDVVTVSDSRDFVPVIEPKGSDPIPYR